jgi:hypothetical protein
VLVGGIILRKSIWGSSSSSSSARRIRPCTVFQFRITYEIMTLFHIWQDCLDGDRPDARTLPPRERTTQKDEDKHPCIERNSNPSSQYPTDQDPRPRPRGHRDRHGNEPSGCLKGRGFLVSWETTSFSRRILLYEVRTWKWWCRSLMLHTNLSHKAATAPF